MLLVLVCSKDSLHCLQLVLSQAEAKPGGSSGAAWVKKHRYGGKDRVFATYGAHGTGNQARETDVLLKALWT